MKLILLMFSLIVVSISFSQTDEEYEKISDSLIFNKQYDELFDYFLPELEKHPNNEKILRAVGYAYIATQNYKLGEEYYFRALKVNPNCINCYFNIGLVYDLQDNYEKSLEYYNKVIELDSVNVSAYLYRSGLYERNNNKFAALMGYKKAIELEPENSNCYISRGLFNLNNNYEHLALSDFTKAIELAPDSYYSYFQRSSLYYNQQKLDLSLIDINKALELDSSHAELYIARGALYSVKNEKKKALVDYSKAIYLDSTYFLGYLNRALIYYELENLDSSCVDYKKCKELMSEKNINDSEMLKEVNSAIIDYCELDKPSYYYQRGVGYYNLEKFSKAVEIYEQGLKKFPNNSMILSFKGNALLELKDYENAIVNYKLALENKEKLLIELKLNPRFENFTESRINEFYQSSIATIYMSIAECYIYLGNINEALIEVNNAIDYLPVNSTVEKANFYNMRGRIYLSMQKNEKALVDFNKSVMLNEKYAITYVFRAIVMVSMTEKNNISLYSATSNFKNKPISVRWNMPSKSELKKVEYKLLTALKDCNKAIELDKNLGFAYYIRGQIKQMLQHSDYCMDFLTAKNLGIIVESEFIEACSN